MTDWVSFGDRRSFAIEARLIPDPQPDSGPQKDVWSYGEWRLYVRGRCLTRHTAPGGIRDEVRWYLAPLLQWLGKVWSPLFHEQRAPASTDKHDHLIVAFELRERILLEDGSEEASQARAEMQAWRARHALWTAAAGGVFPNVWFRRQSDLMEISYDPGVTISAPRGLEFQFNRGATLVDAAAVARPLLDFLTWGRNEASSYGQAWAITTPETEAPPEDAEVWLLGWDLADILKQRGTGNRTARDGVLYPLSPEVAMFGTLTSNLSAGDANALLEALHAARNNEPEPS